LSERSRIKIKSKFAVHDIHNNFPFNSLRETNDP